MKNILINFYLVYLRFFAKLQLKKISPIIIGVGGASGKSSVTALIYEILSKKYKVLQGKGKNSETGIPLNILGIDISEYTALEWIKILFLAPIKVITNTKKYDYYIVEMGIDSPFPPKNMDYLLKIIKPNVALLTNISIEHSVYFDPLINDESESDRKRKILELISRQEGQLLRSIDGTGRTIINIDDPDIKRLLPLKSKTVILSSKNKDADFYFNDVKVSKNEFVMKFVFLRESYNLKLSRPLPKYYGYSFIMAIAAGFAAGVSIKESITILENDFKLPPGRFSVFKGIKETLILDSSYNSSLEAATGALEVMGDIAGTRRKVGILGDMRELGSLSRIQHELLANKILKTLDMAILIGPQMKEFVSPILESNNFKYISFLTFKESKDNLSDILNIGDVVLVKGSQNMLFLERVVELLLENKEDRGLLCRRGNLWNKIRIETP